MITNPDKPERHATDTTVSIGRRVLGGAVDAVLWYLLALVMGIVVAVVRPVRSGMSPLVQDLVSWTTAIIGFGIPVLALVIDPLRCGKQTIGQQVVGIRVLRHPSLEPLGVILACSYVALAVVSIPLTVVLLLASVMGLRCSTKRTWYDRLTGTVMVTGELRGVSLQSGCHACGYDLRGSLASGRCPECGTTFDAEEVRSAVAGQEASCSKTEP